MYCRIAPSGQRGAFCNFLDLREHSEKREHFAILLTLGSILQYFQPSLRYHLSLRPLFCLFLSGCFTQVFISFFCKPAGQQSNVQTSLHTFTRAFAANIHTMVAYNKPLDSDFVTCASCIFCNNFVSGMQGFYFSKS